MDAAQAAAHAHAMAAGRRYHISNRPGPVLDPADHPRAGQLEAELFRETRGRGRFAAFPEDEFHESAGILARYRIASLETLHQTPKDARAMFMRDLREAERRPFPELQLMLQILGHFPPIQLQIRPNTNDPAYEELVIPERLRTFTADLSGIGTLLKPTHEMSNYISLEVARGQAKVPAYTPFIVPDVSACPWPVPSKEHQAAVTRWRTSAQQSKDKPTSIPMKAWLLYRMLFLIAADLAGDWAAFKGF